jgi:hypothetical protein
MTYGEEPPFDFRQNGIKHSRRKGLRQDHPRENLFRGRLNGEIAAKTASSARKRGAKRC